MIKVDRLFPFYSSRCFLKEIRNIFSVFLSSYRITRESLEKLKKLWKLYSISCSPKLPLVFLLSNQVMNSTFLSRIEIKSEQSNCFSINYQSFKTLYKPSSQTPRKISAKSDHKSVLKKHIQWNPDFSSPRFAEPRDISDQTLFPLDLLHSSSIISPSISRTLDFSKLLITRTNFGSRGTN